jgi:membrane fusion protein (multidrug efflux system)
MGIKEKPRLDFRQGRVPRGRDMKYLRVFTIFLIFLLVLTSFQGCKFERSSEKKEEGAAEKAEKDESEKDNQEEAGEEDETALPVSVHEVARGDIAAFHLANATMEAEEAVDVFSQVAGLIIGLHAEEGDHVRRGDLLAKVEEVDYKLLEAKQRENYEKCKNDFERMEKVYAKGIPSQVDYDNSKHNFEQAKIDWEQAKLNLERTAITAPIPGVISERHIKLGQRIQNHTRVYSLVNLKSIVAKVHIPEKDISSLRIGQKAILTTDSFPDAEFPGYIKRISPVVDPSSGTVKVTVALNNGNAPLKPGMFVTTKIITDVHKQTIVIPKKAVIYDGGIPVVFRVRDDIAEKILLKIGFTNAKTIEVLEGLEEKDLIVEVGQTGLRNESKVKIVGEEGESGEETTDSE